MLGEAQVQRLLFHCNKIDKHYKALKLSGDEQTMHNEMKVNEGWCQALRLVLQENTYPISNKPIEEQDVL